MPQCRAYQHSELVGAWVVGDLLVGRVPAQVLRGFRFFRVVDRTGGEGLAREGTRRGAHASLSLREKVRGRASPGTRVNASGDGGVKHRSDGLRIAFAGGDLGAVVQVADVRNRDRGDDADDGDDDEHFHEAEASLAGGIELDVFHGVTCFGCWCCFVLAVP